MPNCTPSLIASQSRNPRLSCGKIGWASSMIEDAKQFSAVGQLQLWCRSIGRDPIWGTLGPQIVQFIAWFFNNAAIAARIVPRKPLFSCRSLRRALTAYYSLEPKHAQEHLPKVVPTPRNLPRQDLPSHEQGGKFGFTNSSWFVTSVLSKEL